MGCSRTEQPVRRKERTRSALMAIRLNPSPPFTPASGAGSMRAIHTSGSVQAQRARTSPACVALGTAAGGASGCVDLTPPSSWVPLLDAHDRRVLAWARGGRADPAAEDRRPSAVAAVHRQRMAGSVRVGCLRETRRMRRCTATSRVRVSTQPSGFPLAQRASVTCTASKGFRQTRTRCMWPVYCATKSIERSPLRA
jgi:hypothetical protein